MAGRFPFSAFQDHTHRAFRVATLAANMPRYAVYYLRLKQSAYGRVIPKGDPFFDRKFVTPYLALSLSARDRLRIQTHLFETLETRFESPTFAQDLKDGIVVWSEDGDAGRQSVTLSLPVRTMLEGDLLLEFQLDGAPLYRFSFAIVPAGIVGGQETIVIGGSQGVPGTGQLARAAAKANGEISPASMLMLALRGICQCLDLSEIHGVAVHNQPVMNAKADVACGAYDALWQQNGGTACNGFYVMPVSLNDAAQDSHGANRSRTRRKRLRKSAILGQIYRYFSGHICAYPSPAYLAIAAE